MNALDGYEYPKIETLFDRDGTFRVQKGHLRIPEFGLIDSWFATEKINGTNVRVEYYPTEGTDFDYRGHGVRFKGKNAESQLSPRLIRHLEETYTTNKLAEAFIPPRGERPPHVLLYMEGYGHKIQDGDYRNDISSRLFDVFVVDSDNPLGGWWLEPAAMRDVADKLGVKTVPYLSSHPVSTDELVNLVEKGYQSWVAHEGSDIRDFIAEGIVARTCPMLFTRKGERLIWKLKRRDFTAKVRP